MKSPRRSGSPAVACGLAVALALALTLPAAPAGAGVKVFDSDDHSLELGLRVQPRLEFDQVPASSASTEGQRDFMIRRTRIKANGRMQNATYVFEWKIDGTDQIGSTPSAAVENAYLQFPIAGGAQLRAGLYDAPFSRDLLTSDSKQLAVDRGEVSAVPSALGLVDNVVGFHILGQMNGGRAQYAVGLFDNRTISGKLQDTPMVAGRLDINLGSTKDLYQDAHFGNDSWYSFGINGSHQGSLENAAGATDSSNTAGGVDAMIDVPFGGSRVFVRAELNAIRTEIHGGLLKHNATVRMGAVGLLLLDQRFQPFLRFDQVRGDEWARGGRRDITYAGANLYKRGHNLKLQGDLRFQSGTNDAIDGARLQAQIDF